MGHLGQDMDIFGDIFSNWAVGPADDKDKEKDLGTGDQTDNTDRDTDKNIWTDLADDKTDTTDKVDIVPDKTDSSNISDEDSNKEDDKKSDLKEWETDEVLDDLVKTLEDNIDKVDDGNADAKQILQNTLSDLQEANLKIKELEEQWKIYQDKYFEKFWESSEMNLMKPLVQTIQEDPELFLLVKSFKSSDSDSKVNSLVRMLEKETGMDVSDYLTDNWKWAMASTTSTWSDSWMKQWAKSDFTPDKVQPTWSEDLF